MFVWAGKKANDVIVIGRVVSAELRLYWPSCVCIGRVASVLAELLCIEFVAQMIRAICAIQILYY